MGYLLGSIRVLRDQKVDKYWEISQGSRSHGLSEENLFLYLPATVGKLTVG